MSGYGVTCESTVCYPELYRFQLANSIFMKKKKKFIPLKTCFAMQENDVPTITLPKQMQTLLFYWLKMPQPF